MSRSPWAWLAVIPAVWFVGMVFSHLVFHRCVLNELARRLAKVKQSPKVYEYKKVNYPQHRHGLRKVHETGALLSIIPDET